MFVVICTFSKRNSSFLECLVGTANSKLLNLLNNYPNSPELRNTLEECIESKDLTTADNGGMYRIDTLPRVHTFFVHV